ncbi:ATP-binding protein [Nodosilinea sp. LEGE 07088]|uniref:AAA family ATPase n=1 Tax=Nodosilinea sp. LEGE 07088 TaxID=2777968 RepID=UPI00187E0A2D|nr:ATP-binding protein [Nodosilinea sp. LEGE 07088]MBE9137042.1 ATP-binding protein [Nodosilinea sp. LEGE 07088]
MQDPFADLFLEAHEQWDLEALAYDLAEIRERSLPPVELVYLRGLLCYCSPQTIAEACNVVPNTVAKRLSTGLYRYVEQLLQTKFQQAVAVNSWSDIPKLLSQVGYKRTHFAAEKGNQPVQPGSRESLIGKPGLVAFYGRETELATLTQWITKDKTKFVSIWGQGGMGKTTLVAKLVEAVEAQFNFIIWRSLRNAPSFQTFAYDLLSFIHGGSINDCPTATTDQISVLLDHFRQHPYLVVLDDIQTVLASKTAAGQYREGYEAYGELFRRLEEEPLRDQNLQEEAKSSCIIVTSWEQLREEGRFTGEGQSVRSFKLRGLGTAAEQILAEKKLEDRALWDNLIRPYGGNPWALKVIADYIDKTFAGSVAEFLDQNTLFLGDFAYLLHQQFARLSPPEKQVLTYLAKEDVPMTIAALAEIIPGPMRRSELMTILQSLSRRALVETSRDGKATHFSLQPTVMKYVTFHQK